MPDSFVHIKGIKKPTEHSPVEPGFYSHGFVCRYNDVDDLRRACYEAMDEITNMQGMVVVRDENLPANTPSNLMFVPMHMMSRIEIDIKPLVGAYPSDPTTAVKQ